MTHVRSYVPMNPMTLKNPMTHWALSIARFTGTWMNKIIKHQNFNFQLLGYSVQYQNWKLLKLPENLYIDYLDIDKNETIQG